MNLKCCGLSFLSKSNSDSDIKDDLSLSKLEKNNSFQLYRNGFNNNPNTTELNFKKNSNFEKNISLNNISDFNSFEETENRGKKRYDKILKNNQKKDKSDKLSMRSLSDLELSEMSKNNIFSSKNSIKKRLNNTACVNPFKNLDEASPNKYFKDKDRNSISVKSLNKFESKENHLITQILRS